MDDVARAMSSLKVHVGTLFNNQQKALIQLVKKQQSGAPHSWARRRAVQDLASTAAQGNRKAGCKDWVAVKGLLENHYSKETLLVTLYPYYGNLI